LISAFADVKDWIEGLQLGVADYIIKPFQTEELLTRVKTHLALGRANVSLEQQAAELRQTNEQLQSEMGERRRVEAELRQSLDLAERSRGAMLSVMEDQKRAESEAARTARQWQTTFDATNDAVWILDADHRVLRSNKTAERFFKHPCSAMLGEHCWVIVHGTMEPHPDCPFVRARGSGHREAMILQDGERWLEITVDPIFEDAGPYAGAVHIVSDITERVRSHEARTRLEAQLSGAQKMEALGTLAGGIAHDFNNILGVIIGNTELARQDVGSDHPALASLGEIGKASRRAKDLVQRILAFGSQNQQPQTVIPLGPVVEEALMFLRATLPTAVTIVTTLKPTHPQFWRIQRRSIRF